MEVARAAALQRALHSGDLGRALYHAVDDDDGDNVRRVVAAARAAAPPGAAGGDDAPVAAACAFREPGGWTLLHVVKSVPVFNEIAPFCAPEAATTRDVDGRTPLHCVVSAEVAAAMLERFPGAASTLSVQDVEFGWTPLHCACEAKRAAVVELLLSAAPDAVSLVDGEGRTPLHAAAGEDCEAAVAALLRVSALEAAIANEYGDTPLHEAKSAGVAKLLVDAAPEVVHARDDDGRVPLHHAVTAGVAAVLLATGTPEDTAGQLCARDEVDGWLPVHSAAGEGRADVLSLLLDASPAHALAKDRRGCTPMHIAAEFNWHQCVRELLAAATPTPSEAVGDSGGLVDEGQVRALLQLDDGGRTPLHSAAARGSLAAVREMLRVEGVEAVLRGGADGGALRDHDGRSPVDCAEAEGHTAAAALLVGAAKALSAPAGAVAELARTTADSLPPSAAAPSMSSSATDESPSPTSDAAF